MAFAFVAARGTATSKASGTTVAVNPTANLNVGALVVVSCASDNTGTTDADDTTEHTVSDSKGNTWTRGKERRYSAGAAADGIETSIWWTVITTQILTTDTITLTLGTARIAKVISVAEFSTAGVGISQVGSVSGTVAANGTGPALTISGLASGREYLFLATDGYEGPNGDSFTQDGNYNGHGAIGTTGSTADTNVDVRPARRILTGTSSTHTGTDTTGSRDWASVAIALAEANATVSPTTLAAVAAVGGAAVGNAVAAPATLAATGAVQGGSVGNATAAPPVAAAVAALPAPAPTGDAQASPGPAAAVAAVSGGAVGNGVAAPATAAAVAAVQGGAVGNAIASGGVAAVVAVHGSAVGNAIIVPGTAAIVVDVEGAGTVDGLAEPETLEARAFLGFGGTLDGIAHPATLAVVVELLRPFVTGIGGGTDVRVGLRAVEAVGRLLSADQRGGIRAADAT